MKLDTPKAVLLGLLAIALAVFICGSRMAENRRYSLNSVRYDVAVRLDNRSGKLALCRLQPMQGESGNKIHFVCEESFAGSQ